MDERLGQSGDTPRRLDGADAPEGVGAPPKFCNRCGVAWDPAWTACPNCARNDRLRASAPGPRTHRQGQRPLRTALCLYFALLGTSAVGIILVTAEALDEPSAWIFVGVADTILVLLWLGGTFRRVRPALAEFARPGWYPLSAALACATCAVAAIFVKAMVSWLRVEELVYTETFFKGGYGWATVILMVCVQPAIIEEIAFRGVILDALAGALGVRDAVIVSSLMFMILHLSVVSFPPLLLIGLVLGWVRVRSGSLYPCMVLHFVHNGLVVLCEMGGW